MQATTWLRRLVAVSLCPAGDPAAISQAIRELIGRTSEERNQMGAQGRDYVIRHHDYRFLAKKFLEVLT